MGFVTAIDHVGLAVHDLDQAIAFYQDAFGMQLVHEEVNEEQGVREAMMAVGDSGSCIQLLAPLKDDSPIGKFLSRNGEGIQQVAYRVSDIDVAADELREAGVGGCCTNTPSAVPRVPGSTSPTRRTAAAS